MPISYAIVRNLPSVENKLLSSCHREEACSFHDIRDNSVICKCHALRLACVNFEKKQCEASMTKRTIFKLSTSGDYSGVKSWHQICLLCATYCFDGLMK